MKILQLNTGTLLWEGETLSRANLSRANLSGADLSGADLSGANLSRASLSGANLSGAIGLDLAIAKTRILPAEGEIIGWKKCENSVIVKLRIPQKAKRSHAFGRKCRAEYVEVLAVIGDTEARSSYDHSVVYRTGETVRCDTWQEDWCIECGGGIHFFITREEAEAYSL